MAKSTKRKKLVVGNWKLNPHTLEEAKVIVRGVKRVFSKVKNVEVVMCPPFTYLQPLARVSAPAQLGAQDVSFETAGAHTGEVSAGMLLNAGVAYTIIGHSERRAMGETSETVAKKVVAATKENLRVILCVGETVRDDHGNYLEFLKNQLKESLAGVQKRYLPLVTIAYEPVWAIGKSYNNAMPGKDVQEISIFIKKVLADMYGKDESAKNLILYGGSVAPVNVEEIMMNGQVDGFLVGRQSLEPTSFNEIISIVGRTK